MAKFRGITYQRNGNKSQDKNQANIPKVASQLPPKSNVYASSELNIDLGGWLSNAKIFCKIWIGEMKRIDLFSYPCS
jgi:hypothetical protein